MKPLVALLALALTTNEIEAQIPWYAHDPARIDPDFVPAVPPKNPNGVLRTSIRPLPDGRLILAAPGIPFDGVSPTTLVRLQRDGSLDPEFNPARLNRGVESLWTVANGGLLFLLDDAGDCDDLDDCALVNGEALGAVVRLESDGRPDRKFHGPSTQVQEITRLEALPDGRSYVLRRSSNTPGATMTVLSRLLATGAPDSGFQELRRTNGQISLNLVLPDSGCLVVAGRTLVSVDASGVVSTTTAFESLRLAPDGHPIDKPTLHSLWPSTVFPPGRLFYRSRTSLTELGPDWQPISTGFVPIATDAEIVPASDGGFWRLERTLSDNSVWRLEYNNSDGSPDRTHPPRTLEFADLDPAGRPKLIPEADGNLLVAGAFQKVNGLPRRNLARILTGAPEVRIEISPDTTRLRETNAVVEVRLRRTGPLGTTLRVNWSTGGGSATPGRNYLKSSGSLEFGPGEDEKSISLSLLEDPVPHLDQTLRLLISHPSGAPMPPVELVIASARAAILGVERFPSGGLMLTLAGFDPMNPGARLESSTNLEDWVPLALSFPNRDRQAAFDDIDGADTRFYRLRTH